MDARSLAVTAAILCVATAPAFAATATGRITYISSDGRRLMLDSSDGHTVGARVSLSNAAVADRVRVTYDIRAGDRVITAIAAAPLTAQS